MLRNLRKEFGVAIGAGEAAIRIDTDEMADAIKTISEVCKKFGWELRVFDVLVGVKWHEGEPPKINEGPRVLNSRSSAGDLLNAIGPQAQPTTVSGTLVKFWEELPQPDSSTLGEVRPIILVIKNFHLAFMREREQLAAVIQHLVTDKIGNHKDYEANRTKIYDPHDIPDDSDTGKFIVGLMPAEERLPPEVAPLFKRIVHELPDEEELGHILDGVAPSDAEDDEDNGSGLTPEERKKVCKFALGLTRLQAEGVFSSCLVMHKRIDPAYIWKAKSDILNKEGLVELYTGTERFKDVAGMQGAKDFLKKVLTPNEFSESNPDLRAKGVLFVGAPGVGKSLTAKATGNELGLPTLMVNPGNWMGSFVGESEAKTRKGFQILRAHAPCIAVVDEVEKVMPKSRGGGGDSGVSSRMEGTFLTNMNDLKELIFWVFTANDIKGMHEAFFRAERVDAIFYVPLPEAEQRRRLWQLYGRKIFPKEMLVGKEMKAFPQHLSTDFDTVLAELKKVKKPNVEEWANKFTLSLMCCPLEERPELLSKLEAYDERISKAITFVNDDGWSPAEIKSCCRLACLLQEPLTKTQKRIRPVSISAKRVIEDLEDWAENAALDAETGELYVPSYAGETEDGERTDRRVERQQKGRVRRKVRKLRE